MIGCLDRAMRIFGGAPTYWLTNNEKTVTTTHAAWSKRRQRVAPLEEHTMCDLIQRNRSGSGPTPLRSPWSDRRGA